MNRTVTSDGEYFDIELAAPIDLGARQLHSLNAVMVEGMEVAGFRADLFDDKKRSGMTIAAAADYKVYSATDSANTAEDIASHFRQNGKTAVCRTS